MASSNRHWPSLFKSKPCTTHQWQHHDINPSSLLSPPCTHKLSGLGSGEERSPEPKPRWNPKPEQIRILEAIFNSGMVNPPRDEIRRIRAQLQEYGQVGDANVFYWFQNRKSRSKQKQRHLHSARGHQSRASVPLPAAAAVAGPTSSSSSSSEQSIGSDKINLPMVSVAASPTGSVNQVYFQSPATTEFLVDQNVYLQGTPGFCLSTTAAGELSGLWTELMMGQEGCKSSGVEVSKISYKMQNPNPNPNNSNIAAGTVSGATTTTAVTTTAAASVSYSVAGPVHEIQAGIGIGGVSGVAARSTVFINGVGFEVAAAPLNVREVFGEEAVLIHASGHPVLIDEWGFTLHPLQHGASYYLI